MKLVYFCQMINLFSVIKDLFIYLALGAFFMLIHILFFRNGILLKLHFLSFLVHLMTLISVLLIGKYNKNMMGLFYLLFLIFKMGVFVFIIYSDYTSFLIKFNEILILLGIYFIYLLLETIFIIKIVQKANKNHVY